MKIHVLKRRPEVKTEKVREKRISMEIVVDAYDASERAMSWYYYRVLAETEREKGKKALLALVSERPAA
jgi:calcium binding protein